MGSKETKKESVVVSKRETAKQMRKENLTYAEIGRHLGVSREGVRQLVLTKPKPQPSEPPPPPQVLRIGDVAELLRLHRNTVRRWANSGLLKSYRLGPRGDRRFKREDVEAFMHDAVDKG